jgi:hypothetical protein
VVTTTVGGRWPGRQLVVDVGDLHDVAPQPTWSAAAWLSAGTNVLPRVVTGGSGRPRKAEPAPLQTNAATRVTQEHHPHEPADVSGVVVGERSSHRELRPAVVTR